MVTDPERGGPYTRVIIEKPFGHDLTSARELNRVAVTTFRERQVFRIDHYLGKETVQNLLVLVAPGAGSGGRSVSSSTNASVILAVSDRREAQKVFYAVENAAGWTLQLRPVANVTQPPIDVEGPISMFKDGVTPTNLSHYAGAGK